jgi:hypothetical protein
MIATYRTAFNANFSEEKYQDFLATLSRDCPKIPFRVAESPIFIPDDLKQKLIAAGDEIIKLIRRDDFKTITQKAIPSNWTVPNENEHPHFLTFDFGLCKDENGEVSPMLIEMQGFPSLYGFQPHLAATYKSSYQLNEKLSPFFNHLTDDSYYELLKEIIVGNHRPREVALMDIDAHHQKTLIDFYVTAAKIGIKILALEEIEQQGS